MEKACTSILVGKKATVDGSVMIARNDDTFLPLTPQRFVMRPAIAQARQLVSNQNGFKGNLPANGLRYTATPNADVEKNGLFEESSINAANVAVSATESVYGNPRALAYDPWLPNGLAEDCLPTMVVPYIQSARQGVEYLGQLIAKYGSPEGNGVLFADQNEAWYMEIVTGHHWAATRIPDDAYVITANQVAQQKIDFDDSQNYLWSKGIREFVIEHSLNPEREAWNFRRIFGTNTEKDRHYNTPRVWYGQRYLTPSIQQEPTSAELPFICRADRLISIEDLQYILGSHYNETKFDPLGHGSAEDRLRFRPISLNRTQNSHILQLRNQVAKQNSAIMWLCFGIPSFAPYLPFYTNTTVVPTNWSQTPLTFDLKSAYWLYRAVSMLTETHYAQFIQKDADYLTACRQVIYQFLQQTDNQAAKISPDKVPVYLAEQNQNLATMIEKKTLQQVSDYISQGLTLSKLTFNMDKNL